MAHTRNDTLTAPPEWWRTCKRFNKRFIAEREWRAATRLIVSTREDQTAPAKNQGA
jgi:hypothetical protein